MFLTFVSHIYRFNRVVHDNYTPQLDKSRTPHLKFGIFKQKLRGVRERFSFCFNLSSFRSLNAFIRLVRYPVI